MLLVYSEFLEGFIGSIHWFLEGSFRGFMYIGVSYHDFFMVSLGFTWGL